MPRLGAAVDRRLFSLETKMTPDTSKLDREPDATVRKIIAERTRS